MSRKPKSFSLFFLPILSMGLFSCSSPIHHLEYVYAYGTTWEIHLYEGEKLDAENLASFVSSSSRILDLDSRVEGGIGLLNEQGQVKADPFLLDAINLASEVEALSKGSFSISLGKLTSSWLTSLEKGEALSEEVVSSLLEEAKQTHLKIEGDVIYKIGDGQIDLGAIGKGLCLDKIKIKLDELGIKKYLINAGSSSLLIGENSSPSGEVKVNLDDLKGKYFHAKSIAVSCSSISRQKYEIGGKIYSHIIDANTGLASAKHQAAILVGDKAGLLDGLSTCLMNLGESELKEFEKEGIKGALIDKEGLVYASEGFLL